jgi:hypothetical protein
MLVFASIQEVLAVLALIVPYIWQCALKGDSLL